MIRYSPYRASKPAVPRQANPATVNRFGRVPTRWATGAPTAVGHRADDLTSAAKFEGVQRERSQPDAARPQDPPLPKLDLRRLAGGPNSSSEPKSLGQRITYCASTFIPHDADHLGRVEP